METDECVIALADVWPTSLGSASLWEASLRIPGTGFVNEMLCYDWWRISSGCNINLEQCNLIRTMKTVIKCVRAYGYINKYEGKTR